MEEYYKAHLEKNILPVTYVTAHNFTDLKDGFWINKFFKFTIYSDAKLWVPPHKIAYIEKVIKDKKER